jgi:predicted CoA-substrate-specific enzyme activase
MSYVGVNIGALSVKLVCLRGDASDATVVAHQGRPIDVVESLLAGPGFADAEAFGVCGHLGHIPEVAAIQRALKETSGRFDAVISLGGESFLVYILAEGRIAHVLSHNKCAAGSGEFFVQQIGRMGLTLDEAIRRSFGGTVVPLASRCSVHCKSDITHKLNRNEAAPADILRTLHDSMANKVVSLMEKAQRPLRRVLLIGGMTRNAAMLAALREKQPGAEFVVLPESPWFEAWGCALLTRDEPRHRRPQLAGMPALESLPPLNRYAGRVQVIAAPQRQTPSDGPLVLGLDAGSTTTKAVLIDPSTKGVVASHYLRTRGDPLAAARECLHALATQVGDRPVGLAATTGSARELIGAYLATEHVYNEISAHAAGAAHYDPEVDTIFEIGGQDSKYILLRNGVPVDYAMNNACSAGTGSFLEESAQGDLGLAVSEISGIALNAPAPVHFKATCAAFINSDIRIAQQQGRSRDDIVAGLVYAIAGNYVNRVKGSRAMGKKVFLQGGVALNKAVGHAFAHTVDRPVVIPADPELLGALGVGLLAQQRAGKTMGRPRSLLALAAPEMSIVGKFTCHGCKLCCSIDRFEVAGRRFPFGGHCSRYENVRKRKSRDAATPDLVAQRFDMIFGDVRRFLDPPPKTRPAARSPRQRVEQTFADARSFLEDSLRGSRRPAAGTRLGIPRALTTHSLYPLYAAFFTGLGMDVVLSGVDPQGDLKSYSGFCFPVQIAHGAVLDLSKKRVNLVFMPHVMRMPQPNACRDSYLCPITQAGPYFISKAFPEVRFLSPLLDFTNGYEGCTALVELVVRELDVRRELAESAWAAAVRAQVETEQALHDLGRHALEQAVASGKPAVVLAGHSYNAFSPEASQSVGRKLASMGVTVIPADCLATAERGPTSWHFANQIMNAVAVVRRHPNLFLLCVSNFSCTIDAFTQAMLASELGAKPYLILEIDAHTADAGIQTRLEAFLDIVHNHRETRHGASRSFTPCAPTTGGRIVRSNGEKVSLTDPRVKFYFPNFSQYHSEAISQLTIRWLGLHAGTVAPIDRRQLERGLQHTSGRECLPLPLSIGQLLQIHENRAPGEIAGLLSIRGGAPCVSDSYLGYFERFIAEKRLADIFMVNATAENDYLGFEWLTLARLFSPALVLADILVEVDHVLQVVGVEGSVAQFREEWLRFAAGASSLDQFHATLPGFVERLAALPRTRDPRTCPRVVVTGDFFTRFSPFFIDGVRELYAAHGIILKPVDLADMFLYGAYDGAAGTAYNWGMKPGSLAFAKACTRIFQPDGKQYLQQWLGYQAERKVEQYYRFLFRKAGLLVAGSNDVSTLFETASEHVSPTIYGEIIPSVGKGLEADNEGYDGIILLGPFNCLPYRISEAILKPLSIQRGMPILTFESDGYAVEPSFLRQVEVHIQQVLAHADSNRVESLLNTGRLPDLIKAAVDRMR